MQIQDFRVNCSSIHSLLSNPMGNTPVSEKDLKRLFDLLGKDYEELSEAQKNTAREIMLSEINYEPSRLSDTTMSELVSSYAYQFFGKMKLSKGNTSPKQLEKGRICEKEGISILSKIDGMEYVKNEEVFTNKWLIGIPDIVVKNNRGKIVKIIDIKISYDLPSHLLSLSKKESAANTLEMMGYMDLTKCMNGEIVHILTNFPESMIKEESNQDALKSMVFDDLSITQRVYRNQVVYNKIRMLEVKKKATKAKNWIKELHDKFTNNLNL